MNIGEIFNNKIFELISRFSPGIIGLAALALFIIGVMLVYPDDDTKAKARKWVPWVVIGVAVALLAVAISKALYAGI